MMDHNLAKRGQCFTAQTGAVLFVVGLGVDREGAQGGGCLLEARPMVRSGLGSERIGVKSGLGSGLRYSRFLACLIYLNYLSDFFS